MWDGWHDLFPWYRDGRSFPEGDVSSKIVFNVSNACPASMSTAMVRREIFHTIGFFDPELIVCEDWDLWLRLTEHGLWVHGTREPLARYRRWSGNMSNNKLELAKGNVHVLEKNLRATQRPDLRPLYRRSLELAKANFELACARRMLDSSSHYVPAAVWRAWRCHPRRLKWFMWFALVSWPEFLGGRATARIVHRKLIQKF